LGGPGPQAAEGDGDEHYSFPTDNGPNVPRRLVATILDPAKGRACWTLLNAEEAFLTGDLRVEYYRSATPGLLRAEGRVVRKARRVIFCSADLYQDEQHIAGGRCTQIVLPSEGGAGRVRKQAEDR